MKFARALTRVHRWLGLVLGLQVTIWIMGGVVMSVLPIERVRGEHRITETPPVALGLAEVVTPSDAAAAAGFGAIRSAELTTWLRRPVWRVTAISGEQALVDAATGARLDPLDAKTARAVAEADYAGPGGVSTATYLEEGPREAGRVSPLWRIDFDDADATTLYVSPSTGRVTARRSTTWRVYDFFWMLHIMDYGERENFNTLHLRIIAGVALMFALSGVALVIHRFVLRPRASRQNPTISRAY